MTELNVDYLKILQSRTKITHGDNKNRDCNQTYNVPFYQSNNEKTKKPSNKIHNFQQTTNENPATICSEDRDFQQKHFSCSFTVDLLNIMKLVDAQQMSNNVLFFSFTFYILYTFNFDMYTKTYGYKNLFRIMDFIEV